MTELLTSAMFTPHIGSAFAVRMQEYEDVLTLVEVGDLPHGFSSEAREPFTLLFKGASTSILFDQQILALEHPVLGVTEIMLTPCGRDSGGGCFHYEAVFN